MLCLGHKNESFQLIPSFCLVKYKNKKANTWLFEFSQ